MSEAEHTITCFDEQTMSCDPASNPHLGAKMTPVTDESVPVANGLEGSGPTSSPAVADEPAANEVQPSTHVYHSQDVSPDSEKLDPPSFCQGSERHGTSTEITPDKGCEGPVMEGSHPSQPLSEVAPSEKSITEDVQARESNISHQSNATTVENPSPSDSEVDKISAHTEAVDDAAIESSPVTAGHDSPTESDPLTEAKDEPIVADIPEDVVVSHIVDAPVEPSDTLNEVPTENPFLALEEAPPNDESAPQDTLCEEKREVQDHSLGDAPIANEVSQEDGKDEESQSGPAIVSVKQEEEEPSIENTDVDDLQRGVTNMGGESKSEVESMAEAEPATGLQQVFELATEETPAIDVNMVSQRELILQEARCSIERAPEEESIVSSKVKDAVETNKAEFPEDVTKTDEEVPVEKLSIANLEENLCTGKSRSIDAEQCNSDDQGLRVVAPPAANGVDQPLAGEQDEQKGDADEAARGKVNGFSMKLPLVVTGLAVVVGVAVASMSRSH